MSGSASWAADNSCVDQETSVLGILDGAGVALEGVTTLNTSLSHVGQSPCLRRGLLDSASALPWFLPGL